MERPRGSGPARHGLSQPGLVVQTESNGLPLNVLPSPRAPTFLSLSPHNECTAPEFLSDATWLIFTKIVSGFGRKKVVVRGRQPGCGAWPAPHVLECRQAAQLGAASGRMAPGAALTGQSGRGSVHLWLVPQLLHSAVGAFGVLQVHEG